MISSATGKYLKANKSVFWVEKRLFHRCYISNLRGQIQKFLGSFRTLAQPPPPAIQHVLLIKVAKDKEIQIQKVQTIFLTNRQRPSHKHITINYKQDLKQDLKQGFLDRYTSPPPNLPTLRYVRQWEREGGEEEGRTTNRYRFQPPHFHF